jgi:3',5'-cyclic-AMP phosphodiesterase
LHLTDPHLFADADASLRGRVTLASLQAVLDHFGASGWHADLVQVTGDIVQDYTRDAYLRFRGALSALNLPVYCVPGNHDLPSVMREVLTGAPFHYCDSRETGNWLIAGVDSSVENSAAGLIREDELERLDGLIATSAADHVMVCLHHPPLPVGSNWLDEVGLRNAEDFLHHVAASGKTRLLIFGHVHQAFDDVYGPLRIIGTPSTCRQFAVGSNTYALDDNPPAYRRLELHRDGRVDTELVWI